MTIKESDVIICPHCGHVVRLVTSIKVYVDD